MAETDVNNSGENAMSFIDRQILSTVNNNIYTSVYVGEIKCVYVCLGQR